MNRSERSEQKLFAVVSFGFDFSNSFENQKNDSMCEPNSLLILVNSNKEYEIKKFWMIFHFSDKKAGWRRALLPSH
jgi:hypothetical protein